MKRIELYAFCYNDEEFMPFFLDYYSFVDKMTFIDSGSTDNTLNLIKDHTVIQTGQTWWNWDELFKIKNNIWRNSEYDLVFVLDLDEIMYHPAIRQFLETTDYDIYQAEGFQMVSPNLPPASRSILEIKQGYPDALYNKCSIFKPGINLFMNDSHVIVTNSNNINRFNIKLLHYRSLGVKYLSNRAKKIRQRVPADSHTQLINGNILQVFPGFVRTESQYRDEIKTMLLKSKKVI